MNKDNVELAKTKICIAIVQYAQAHEMELEEAAKHAVVRVNGEVVPSDLVWTVVQEWDKKAREA